MIDCRIYIRGALLWPTCFFFEESTVAALSGLCLLGTEGGLLPSNTLTLGIFSIYYLNEPNDLLTRGV
jgi:hypothetical protein